MIALVGAVVVVLLAVVAFNVATDQRPSSDQPTAPTPLPVGATPPPYDEAIQQEIEQGQLLGRVPSGVEDVVGVERVLNGVGGVWDCAGTGRPMPAGFGFFVCASSSASEGEIACDVTLTADGDVVKGACHPTLPEGGSGGD